MSELAVSGHPYDVAVVQVEADLEAPAGAPHNVDARLTMRDVILVRHGGRVKVTGTSSGNFVHNLVTPLPPVGGSATSTRGWTAVDVTQGGRAYRFVNTHLEAFHPGIRVLQARELLAGPVGAAPGDVILAGDLNTGPDSTPIRYLTGRDVVNGQSTFWMDAWDAAPAGAAGHTIHPTVWSEIEYGDRTDTPYLPGRHPRERFDYLLVHEWSYGHAGDPLRARRFGEGAFRHDGHDLTISDHLGVIADLYLPEGTLLAAGGA